MNMTNLAFAIASFLLILLLSLVFLQVAIQANPFFVLIAFAVLINMLTAAGGHLIIPRLRYWYYAPPFYLLVMITIFCLGAVFSSASLQMLQAVAQSGGATTVSAMHESVINNNLLKRLEEHVAAGRIRRLGEAYYLTDEGRFLIGWVERWKSFFSIKQAGIY